MLFVSQVPHVDLFIRDARSLRQIPDLAKVWNIWTSCPGVLAAEYSYQDANFADAEVQPRQGARHEPLHDSP